MQYDAARNPLSIGNALDSDSLDKSSPEKLAESLERILLGVGSSLGEDPTPELYADAPPPTVSAKQYLRLAHNPVTRKRIKVVTVTRRVAKPPEVFDFDDDTVDFARVTVDFVAKHDSAVAALSDLMVDILAWDQALRHTVEKFKSHEAFADLTVNTRIMQDLLTLNTVERLSGLLGVDKDVAIRLLAKREDKK